MAETLVADLSTIPQTYVPYSVERSVTKSELIKSGIAQNDLQLNERADIGFDVNLNANSRHGGQYTSMPFWQALSGADEVLSDTGSLTTDKMATSAERAVIHNRAKAWSHNDMTGIVAASDPATALGELLGDYWNERTQQMFLSTLAGVFSAASMSGNNHDIHLASGSTFTDANYLTVDSFIDAKQLMGDAKDKLTAIIMHSKTEAALEKEDLITFIPSSDQGMPIKVFSGKQVILDDTMTIDIEDGTTEPSNVYNTFLFARGAFGYGIGSVNGVIRGAAEGSTWAAEWARETLAGQNIFVNRRRSILHPRGFKFLGGEGGTMAGISPTNAELALGTNWLRTWAAKNVPMVRIQHNNPGG